jgi:tetratricopeptide (TPR) repeat protein
VDDLTDPLTATTAQTGLAGQAAVQPDRVTLTSAQMEHIGTAAVKHAFSVMGWAVRDFTTADHGIDVTAELDGLTSAPTARYLAVQIKCGPSYFTSKTSGGWKYRDQRHLSYWLANLMPVILVLVDPDTGLGYWVQITHDAVQYTASGWWIEVPEAQVLGRSRSLLRELALSTAPATADPVERALPLLPPSTVEMLSTLDTVDRDGALRLAKYLCDGRSQPRETVEALLDASRVWPQASGLRLATIGAYANDHGLRDLAITAFDLAAEHSPADGLRLRGVAALMAVAAGDRSRADTLLRGGREHPGTSLLADVALRAFDADKSARDDALETLLREVAEERLDAEPTCLLFLAERAFARADLEQALELFERSCRRSPDLAGGLLGQARVLIERVIRGLSAVPDCDLQTAVRLATTVRDQMRRWSGPSETAHRLLVQERILAQAFAEVIELATPIAFGGLALDREAVDPVVAIAGAQASIAMGDRRRAARFADAMRNTATEPLLRAIAADPGHPRDRHVTLWRTALDTADSTLAARTCLHRLATYGALDPAELAQFAELANLDDDDRVLFTARNNAGAGDLNAAIALLRSQSSPAAAELLAEILRDARRVDEALAVCDQAWQTYGALKALQDKINILASRGDLDGAETCAAQLLTTGGLPLEQRRQLHSRMIERRAMLADWAGVEACCRAALRDEPGNHDNAWGLILAQLNQDRWDAAWASYRQLLPGIDDPDIVRAWVELHLRFGMTPQAQSIAAQLKDRFAADPDPLAHLARLDTAPA